MGERSGDNYSERPAASALPWTVLSTTLARIRRILYSRIMYERIAVNPKICRGQACVRGTRIPVHQTFRMLANGDSVAFTFKLQFT